ncbi:type II toxin-antitoxin system CcdA family antitoxin [Archaeoglobus sp.]
MKRRTSVYIDADLLAKAKEKKLNLSQLLEKAIREALKEGGSSLKTPSRRGPRVQIPPPRINF